MLHPVVARKHFNEVGIEIDTNTYIPEGSVDAHLVEKLLMRHARWLSRDKKGVLVGFHPEEDLQIGSRLVLNHNGTVQDTDVFWANFSGDESTHYQQLILEGQEDAMTKARETHGFIMLRRTARGWAMGTSPEGEVIALCRNYVAAVSHIERNL
ncbi:hypothetical protein [Pseudomonas phage D6]|nr:hypothetical protein [Pseudomonas phage D6]